MRLLHLKATIQDDEGNYIASRATYSLAIESLNALRNQFYQAKGKANLQEEALSLLADAANSTWRAWNEFGKRADLEALYSVVQQGKSALLTDHLRNNRALRFGGLPESVLQQEQQLQSDLVFYQTKIAEERGKGAKKDSALLERWLGKSLSIETSQRQLAAQLEREYPAYFNLKYDTQTIDIQVIQSRMLGAEEAILECFIANETLYLFWIHRDEVQVRKLASDTIESLALSLHEALKKPGLPFESQSSQLYAKLLAPFIKEQIPGSIIVVPDGLLGYIPFEVLLTNAQPTSADYRSLPYLGKQSQVSYSYAVRLLLDGKRRSGNKKFAGFAPGYPPLSESNNESSALAGLVRDGLWELPGARREVEEIAALVDGTAFLGEEATESVFRSQAPQYGLLHLAMHALVDDQNPLQSYLVFTQNDQDEHDGLLHASELYSMNLPAQLAVLSACNTGYGSLRRGEGIMSLSRAFAYAGCPSTVMSLWQAPDKETGVLMEEFYQKLSQGLHKHDALQQAKLRYLEEAYTPALGHPFYWAGFVFLGENKPISSSSNTYLWILAGIALFGLGIENKVRK